jgi:hypothetical protein
MSKSDDEFYARLERKQAKERKRLKRLTESRPQIMELIRSVKLGEITLEEAQRLAAKL